MKTRNGKERERNIQNEMVRVSECHLANRTLQFVKSH